MVSVTVAAAIERDFSPEHAVYDDKIHHREAHAEAPPDQADLQGVGAGYGFLDGDVISGIVAGWKQTGIERNRRADQHQCEISAGAGESSAILLLAGKIQDANKGGENRGGHNKQDRIMLVI